MAMVPRKLQSHFFSASDDSTMTKQIRATHAPVDDERIDVRPLLNVVQHIFNSAASIIPGIVQGKPAKLDGLMDSFQQSELTDMLDITSHTINKVSCEISCKCLSGGDAHATTMGILSMLSRYSWEAKVVIALAAFATNFGKFWLLAQVHATNPLARSVAMLKHIHETLEQVNELGPKFEAISHLLKAMLDVTNYIMQFHELPSQYIDPEAPETLAASNLIPSAVYWTIRSIIACATQILGIIGLGQGFMSSTIETWELSSLAHKLSNINSHLLKQLDLCRQHLDDNKQREAFETLQILFQTSHPDNMKILKALIYNKDDMLPLFDGSTKQRVSIEVLRKKIVLLYITDLHHISDQEIMIFEQMYQESRQESSRFESQYELVWIPIVDKGTPWTEEKQNKFVKLQSMMTWYSLYDPSMLEPATIRYIKEVWLFNNVKPIIVVLDQQGKVVNLNAIHMMWIWGSLAYPFSSSREEALWKQESWRLELLADTIHPSLYDWIAQGTYICLYGGDDIEWIRKFTRKARSLAETLKLPLEMIYVGRSNPGEKVRKINTVIEEEKLSNTLPDPGLTLIWFFWVRLESMWHSKLQQEKKVENDEIMQEIMRILGFDSSEQGWVVMSRGTENMMAKGKGDTFLNCLNDYDQWKDKAEDKGVLPAMDDYIQGLQTPHHCNRLILPGTNGRIPDKVVCVECGRPMEKFYMYRCCTD
ncbi:protein SIEVE ELEMENT OCCLUSION B [Arachis hypogaea]|uniref:Sieve element occlusion N-terminal domain-containing protein n=1 Tax=Arachis hypogaea TaxID=3818 RepID=A0A445DN32_ARAHY|nr:protein SIEVE ELEMENT OCCLUSION B [Arachis hypogaea]QHO59818.1 Protein SIEVE ELEMENT OCCLUSION B [Arachis hypogaea]RYR64571.1 hypothetical protein Ahy_A03g010648 [Arachis hypogaea]